MLHPSFRTAILLTVLWLSSALQAQVQVQLGDLHVSARKADGKVLVKCMPTNASTWYRMMQNGAEVKLEGRSPITLRHGNAEAFAATSADPEWKDALAKLATEIPAPKVAEGDMDAMVRASKDFERNYLGWILLTAYHPELSALSGFQFELPDDGRDISGSVSVEGVAEEAFEFTHNELRSDLKGIPFSIQGGDKAATLIWTHAALRGYAVAYLIERGRDGKSFEAIGPPVIYDRLSKGVGDDPLGIEWVDPLPANDETWHYRLVALDAFGMRSVENTVLTVTPREDPALPPFEGARIQTKNDGSATISWTYPALDRLKGFQVIHSVDGPMGNYALSHPDLLSASTRSFAHKMDPNADVHYRIIAVNQDGSATPSDLVYRAIADTLPPDIPVGLTVEVDSTGLASIRWNTVQDRDLKGYRVFKSYQQQGGFVQLTNAPIADTLFTDTLSLQRLDKKAYYQVVAVDGNYNQSPPSVTAVGHMIDVVAPTAPLLVTVETDREHRVNLVWKPSSSPDVLHYDLQYRDVGDTLFRSLHIAPATEVQFLDAGFKEVPHWREYHVLAVDSAGNVSTSNLRRAVRRDRNARPPAPTDVIAQVKDGSVLLSWRTDPAMDLSHLLLYLQQGSEGKPELMDRVKAQDTTTSPVPAKSGDQYSLQAVTSSGVRSTLSKAVEVRMP